MRIFAYIFGVPYPTIGTGRYSRQVAVLRAVFLAKKILQSKGVLLGSF